MSSRREFRIFLIFGGFFLLWNFISWRFPFFWDTILNAKIASHYLENGFEQLIPPESMDAGHPPFFSVYLGLVWKVFGRSLGAAHLAMLPFLLGITLQYANLAKRFLPPRAQVFAMILLVLEPTFLAQSSMVSGDLVLLFGLLLGLNAILDNRTGLLGIALLMMALISLRGIMALGVLFICDFGYHYFFKAKKLPWKHLIAYASVGILILGWFGWHANVQGWAWSPPPETYGSHREILGLKGILRNIGLVGWRFLDFGRVGLWLVMITLLIVGGIRKKRPDKAIHPLIFLFLASTTAYTLLFIPFSNPIGHRYYLFAYLLFTLLTVYGLYQLKNKVVRISASVFLVLILVSGHFWIYPPRIAQGWDSSLAHLAYFPLRYQMDEYILNNNELDPEAIGADFPMVNGSSHTRITDETWSYQSKGDSIGFDGYPFLLESNINNGYSDQELIKLEKRFETVREYRFRGVYLKLWQRR